jgi:hypothetical protein
VSEIERLARSSKSPLLVMAAKAAIHASLNMWVWFWKIQTLQRSNISLADNPMKLAWMAACAAMTRRGQDLRANARKSCPFPRRGRAGAFGPQEGANP